MIKSLKTATAALIELSNGNSNTISPTITIKMIKRLRITVCMIYLIITMERITSQWQATTKVWWTRGISAFRTTIRARTILKREEAREEQVTEPVAYSAKRGKEDISRSSLIITALSTCIRFQKVRNLRINHCSVLELSWIDERVIQFAKTKVKNDFVRLGRGTSIT